LKIRFLILLNISIGIAGILTLYISGNEESKASKDTAIAEDAAVAEDSHKRNLIPVKAMPERISVRRRIAQLIEKEVIPIEEQNQLDDYLMLLKDRAKENGRVTAMEVQPGIEAISKFETILGPIETMRRRQVFTGEMASLSKEFGDVPDAVEPLSAKNADALLEKIASVTDEDQRRQIVGEYLDRADTSDTLERHAALISKLVDVMKREKDRTSNLVTADGE
jgi:hypothetical protein